MQWYEIWRMNDDRPAGNPDCVGTIEARDEVEAETLGRFHFGISPSERVSVQTDEEGRLSCDTKLPPKRLRGRDG